MNEKPEINDIVIIGSGPSSLLCVYYFMLYYPNLKISIITPKMEIPLCTYGMFMSQIEDEWLLKHIKKNNLFSKIMDICVNCSTDTPVFKDGKLSENVIEIDDKYGIINNKNFYLSVLQKIESTENVNIILGTATQIFQNTANEKSIYYYNKHKILHSIISKFVIEGIGNYRPIGIRYRSPYNIYKQSFVGYKIRLGCSLKSVGLHDRCVLVNWFNKNIIDDHTIKNNIKPSFCYIVPQDDNTLLLEETILILSDKEIDKYGSLIDIYTILEYRLNKRIKMIGFNDIEIIGKETNTIVMNKSIPDSSSKSFGIGQCGNMINITSGYTLGYNIYHMKEICDTIVASGFNTQITYKSYWNYNRYVINKINTIGQMLMNNMDVNELAEFHRNYFLKIVNNKNRNYNHRVLFLNCDNNIKISKLIDSYSGYLEFPFKFIIKIAENTLKYLFGIV